jgi:hypothetical protein
VSADRQGLEIDVDTRLAELWALVWEPGTRIAGALEDDAVRDTFGHAIRAAYCQGYTDAIREVRDGRPGELARTHGYTIR